MSKLEKLSQEKNKPKADASGGIFMSKSEIEALREEAELIESELEEDPFIDSMDPPKELYNRIVQELKDKGIYHEDESSEEVEEKEEVVEKEKKKVVFYTRWQRAGKWGAIVCLSLLGVFGVAMTSEANRVYMLRHVESWFGDDTKLKLNNDDNRYSELGNLESAKEIIEEDLGAEVPNFLYFPPEMNYKSYEIIQDANIGVIQFDWNDQLLSLYISNNQEDTSEFSTYDAKHIQTQDIYKDTIKVDVWELKDNANDKECYMAQWKYKNCYYELSGKIDKDEFFKILDKINF